MKKEKMSSDYMILQFVVLLFFIGIIWFWGLFKVEADIYQGDVYRILYIHVPSAFASFLCSFLLFLQSVYYLIKRKLWLSYYMQSTAEVGLLFTMLTLVTGAIWGKATWGVWWTWDARLTTTFILALLYCGFLLLWTTVEDFDHKLKCSSVLGVVIFSDIPIIYKSVTWWRTLHQPPSILGDQGTTMSPEILSLLFTSSFITFILSVWLIKQRSSNLALQSKIEKQWGTLLI
ncbi:MAG: cytochrome C assembly protein [Zetaproteobacteria bacterium]|nr:cytochrome C assembly protein [Pseudobdellovibrionaceae bacterium]